MLKNNILKGEYWLDQLYIGLIVLLVGSFWSGWFDSFYHMYGQGNKTKVIW